MQALADIPMVEIVLLTMGMCLAKGGRDRAEEHESHENGRGHNRAQRVPFFPPRYFSPWFKLVTLKFPKRC